jgi:hypothetical protein
MITVIVASAAVATFSASGQGDTYAISGSMLPVTVAATVGGDTPTTQLQPGSSADVILRVTNNNSMSVVVTSVSGNGPITASGAIGSCSVTGVSFTDQSGLSITVAANSTILVDLPAAAAMSTSSSSGCQGADFQIPVAITAEKL